MYEAGTLFFRLNVKLVQSKKPSIIAVLELTLKKLLIIIRIVVHQSDAFVRPLAPA